MLAYGVREHGEASQILKKKKRRENMENKKNKTKKIQITHVVENVMQEDQKGNAARTTYVLKRNRYLLHGRNSTKITPVAETKQHKVDNCCFTDKNNTKRKKIPVYGRCEGN